MKKRIFALILTFSLLISFASCGNVLKTKEFSSALTQTHVVLKSKLSETEKYNDYFSLFSESEILVPGLFEGLIPQGLCYDDENGNIIISGYYQKGELPSRVAIIDKTAKSLIKSVEIELSDGTLYTGHAGGLAQSEGYVYITGSAEAIVIKKEALLNAKDGDTVKASGNFKINTDGSFANCSNGVLWVGTFVENAKSAHEKEELITTLPSGETFYAYCEGYILEKGLPSTKKLNTAGDGYIPDYFFAVPDEVQGFTVTPTGKFVFSSSYGRRNDSVIRIFDDITDSKRVGFVTIDGNEIDLKAASSDLLKKEITAPPMSEGLEYFDGGVWVLYESGASKYRSGGGKYPIETLHFAEIE